MKGMAAAPTTFVTGRFVNADEAEAAGVDFAGAGGRKPIQRAGAGQQSFD
jgi:hypothetical protein